MYETNTRVLRARKNEEKKEHENVNVPSSKLVTEWLTAILIGDGDGKLLKKPDLRIQKKIRYVAVLLDDKVADDGGKCKKNRKNRFFRRSG